MFSYVLLYQHECSPHPVFNVGFPPHGHVPQVKEFDVAVVVASTHTAVLVVEGMACDDRGEGKWTLLSFMRAKEQPRLSKSCLKSWKCIFYIPNATVQQSLFVSPSMGSMLATGESFCLGSQTFTVPGITKGIWHLSKHLYVNVNGILSFFLPSLLPVTISGAPSPIPRPPTPSMLFTISLWALTVYTATSGISRFLRTTDTSALKELVHFGHNRVSPSKVFIQSDSN